jgi:predicted enzyme related to lactoylglutathione lyase
VGQETGEKERIRGIGGFFFRARDPKTLAEWYERHLGVTRVPETYEGTPWRTDAGTVAFAPFPADTAYFGDSRLQWMINFRVRDLQKMTDQLRAEGIEVELDPEVYPNGRFARLSDPEGNPIQLWQPGGVDRG